MSPVTAAEQGAAMLARGADAAVEVEGQIGVPGQRPNTGIVHSDPPSLQLEAKFPATGREGGVRPARAAASMD